MPKKSKSGLTPLDEQIAIRLNEAWHKYRELMGEDPHGTIPQIRALLVFANLGQLCEPKKTIGAAQ